MDNLGILDEAMLYQLGKTTNPPMTGLLARNVQIARLKKMLKRVSRWVWAVETSNRCFRNKFFISREPPMSAML